ncbi:MAG: hypothetical protein JXR37_32290 [Kiritimatiellae bacterium]|nr:hypothetical protein [Kiritimatiellia bacterium]
MTDSNGTDWTATNDTRYVYDGWRVMAKLASNNDVTNHYTWGLDLSGSREGAGGIGGLIGMTGVGHEDYNLLRYVYFYDGNGNITYVYQDDGVSERASYDYDPFGNITRSSGSMAETNTFRFSTKMFEPDHGLYYYGYRFYSSNLGRWVNRGKRR